MSNWLGVWTIASRYPGFLNRNSGDIPGNWHWIKNWLLVDVSPCPLGYIFSFQPVVSKTSDSIATKSASIRRAIRKIWIESHGNECVFFRRQNNSQTSSCTCIGCSRIRFCSRDVQDVTSILSFGSSGDLWCVILNPENIEYLVQSTASLWISPCWQMDLFFAKHVERCSLPFKLTIIFQMVVPFWWW